MDNLTPHILDDDYRAYMEYHFRAIALMMHDKRLRTTHWTVEVEGCVYKFKPTMYAKRGSKRWEEDRAEQEEADRVCREETDRK